MSDPKISKSPARPAGSPAARPSVPPRHAALTSGPPRTTTAGPATRGDEGAPSGKVVHDERGNAVWDWMKQTGKHAIESTTRMLRKLEVPELKFEDPKDEQLRIMPDPSTGGGYDPYNQDTKPGRKALGKK